MALNAEIEGKKVEASDLEGLDALSQESLTSHIEEIFDDKDLGDLEDIDNSIVLTLVDAWLWNLKIEYTEENNIRTKMAIVIDDKKYLIESPDSFEMMVEERVLSYIQLLELEQQEYEALYANKVNEINVELTEAVVAEQQVQWEVLAEQSPDIQEQIETIEQQPTPTIEELAVGTDLAKTIEDYAAENNLETTAVYEKIRKTQKETLERFFVGIDGSEKFMETVTTATSLYLFARYSQDNMGDARTSIFAQAQNLNIEKDETDFFWKMKGWAGWLDIWALMQVSGMFKFFMVFKDPEVKKAIEEATAWSADMVMNHYLENPLQMVQLMQKYDKQTENKTDRLKKELIGATLGSDDAVTPGILAKYTITNENKAAMTKIIGDYGGDEWEFENFMWYVEQGETILWQVEWIKEWVLQSDQAASIIENIAMIKQSMLSLWAALGLDEEDLAIFDFFDGILGWLWFDGVDGYLAERSAEKHLGPLLEAYKGTEKESNPEEIKKTTYGTLLGKITEDSPMQADIKRLWMAIDPNALYTVMNSESEDNIDYATLESLNKLVPEFEIENYEWKEEEQFLMASAFIVRSMCVSGALGDLNTVKPEKVIKKLMLFLADPAKAAKEFDITKSFVLAYGEGEYTTRMTNLSNEQNKETTDDWVAPEEIVVDDPVEEQVSVFWDWTLETGSAVWWALDRTDLSKDTESPNRRDVLRAMHELVLHNEWLHIWYAHDNLDGGTKGMEAASLEDDNELDCSGMVCEIYRRAGFDTARRSAKWFFEKHYEYTKPLIDQEWNLEDDNMSDMKTWDLIFWSTVDDTHPHYDSANPSWGYHIHHVAMVMNTNTDNWKINIIEVNWSNGFVNRNISPEGILDSWSQLIVANMAYDG